MKQTLLSLVLLSLIVVQSKAQKQGNFSLDIDAEGQKNIKILYLDIEKFNTKYFDVETLTDGKLKKEYTITGNNIYYLKFSQKDIVLLAVQPGENIKVNYQDKDNYQITGSKGSELIQSALAKEKELKTKYTKNISDEYNEAEKANDEEKMVALNKKWFQANQKVKKDLKSFLFDNFDASVAWIIFEHDYSDDIEYLKKLTKRLQEKAPKEVHTKVLSNILTGLINTRIGSIAPEIALKDNDGNVQKLSSLKGKYVLVDFWTSWCGPCRRESPYLVKAYNKYKSKGFEIYGISLDEKKYKWISAVQKDQLTWTNVCDIQGFSSDVAKTYNVRGVPMNFLLDQKGKIIAKDLRGDALDKKLQELFK